MEKLEIDIPLRAVTLKGTIVIPKNATGIVVFSNGNNLSIIGKRNSYTAKLIQKCNLGTIVFDLLTEEEHLDCQNKYNIDLLVSRLIETTEWLIQNNATKNLPIGYFGSNIGAAAAMRAAAYFGKMIKAVVSRGGRPDMVIETLDQITAPTLLIVGEVDVPIISRNKLAFDQLQSVKEMSIIPKATQSLKEPDKLQEATELAITWFTRHFTPRESILY